MSSVWQVNLLQVTTNERGCARRSERALVAAAAANAGRLTSAPIKAKMVIEFALLHPQRLKSLSLQRFLECADDVALVTSEAANYQPKRFGGCL